jgi:hypothetical protein
MTSPNLLYYDVLISNFQNVNISTNHAQFTESRQQAFLLEPSKYDLSVVRWTADTGSLPIWRCQIQPDSTDANASIYSITLQYLGVSYQAYLNYEPQSKVTATPPAPSTIGGLQSNLNLYYDVYSYQYVVYLFNQCFSDAFSQLPDTIQSATFQPSMVYNPDNRTVSLYCDQNYYSLSDSPPVPQIQIFFNVATANLFSSFPYYINALSDDTGKNYQIITDVFSSSNTSPFPPTSVSGDGVYEYTAFVIYQEYSTVSQWNPVTSIVMTSSSLPVAPNAVSGIIQASDINGFSTTLTGQQNNVVFPIITDFCADTSLTGYKPYIYYVPSAEYRRIELLGSTPLTNIDISLFWKGRDGQLNAFILGSGTTVTVKLLFEKK